MSDSAEKPTTTFLDRRRGVDLSCQVHLPDFEGPLDLLLYLIKNHELDLLNLPIAKITEQYLAYLDYMKEMDLDLASDYLVMAATLTYLKSQLILPRDPSEEESGSDPKSQLIRRLIELNNYKELARFLRDCPRLNREFFLARNTGTEEIEDGIEAQVALTNPFQMLEAWQNLEERRRVHVHEVVTDQVPISSCVARIVEELKLEERVTFQKLLPQVYKIQDVISMFLGVLEMSKLQMTYLEQDEIFGNIAIRRKVAVEDIHRANDLIRGMSWN